MPRNPSGPLMGECLERGHPPRAPWDPLLIGEESDQGTCLLGAAPVSLGVSGGSGGHERSAGCALNTHAGQPAPRAAAERAVLRGTSGVSVPRSSRQSPQGAIWAAEPGEGPNTTPSKWRKPTSQTGCEFPELASGGHRPQRGRDVVFRSRDRTLGAKPRPRG